MNASTPILTGSHWRSRLAYAASNFVRVYGKRRGFYRITTAIRRRSRTWLGGNYVPVSYRGKGTLWINPANDMDSAIFSRGVYEPGTIALIEQLTGAGYAYVDVGGNIGTHVIAAALVRKGSSGQTFTVFEPSPFTLPVLRWNLRENGLDGLVCLRECAVSGSPGELVFYAAPGHNPGNDGISRRDPSQVEIRVPAVRIDEVLTFPLPETTLFKIDAEGSEPNVLAGAERLLASTAGLIVLFEHNTRALAAGGFPRDAVTSLLPRQGFRFWELIESSGRLVSFDPAAKEFCNCLAARELPPLLKPRLG